MTDYFRKPAPGTDARDRYEADAKKRREPCKCGSKLRTYQDGTCLACNPRTLAQYRIMRTIKP